MIINQRRENRLDFNRAKETKNRLLRIYNQSKNEKLSILPNLTNFKQTRNSDLTMIVRVHFWDLATKI